MSWGAGPDDEVKNTVRELLATNKALFLSTCACDTGRVTAYEPPERVVLAWQLDERWHYDPDPAHASEVEVRFIAEGPSQPRVGLEHRGFERHGAGGAGVPQGRD